ncbi:unnamed protein product [Heterobilharzia americana]|nr:unnamed protein product [Heterobilharzia americana]CAH8652492.1 unnamed protein product [Heterobilharzia americana]
MFFRLYLATVPLPKKKFQLFTVLNILFQSYTVIGYIHISAQSSSSTDDYRLEIDFTVLYFTLKVTLYLAMNYVKMFMFIFFFI